MYPSYTVWLWLTSIVKVGKKIHQRQQKVGRHPTHGVGAQADNRAGTGL